MRATKPAWAIAFVAIAVGARAQAHERPRPWVMVDVSPAGYLGASMMIGSVDTPGTEATVVTTDLVAELSASRLKAFLRLPIAYAGGYGDSGAGLGNLTGGLAFVSASGSSEGSRTLAALGASLSLPTASDGGGEATTAAVFAAELQSLHDYGLYLPDITTLRLFGDLRLDSGRLFLQGELGLNDYLGNDESQLDLRIGLAAGVRMTHTLSLVAELTTISDVFDERGDSQDWVHGFDIGLRHDSEGLSLAARLFLPLDRFDGDDESIGVGLEAMARF